LQNEKLTNNPDMKTLLKLLTLLTITGFILTSCEGPMGPAGEDGTDGIDGIDATASCLECHNNDALVGLKVAQWETSMHATGGNAAYANRTGCVQCHTSQGFLEYVAEGSTAAISVPAEPMQINCYTCHKIHSTFTESDWDLTKPGAQTLNVKYAGADVVWDKGSSNQCVACHQSFAISPAPVLDGPDFEITNTRMGTHHGPMANLVLGKTAFELSGTAYPTTNVHSTGAGCVTCHMATPYGYQAGGHNMGMEYDSHGTAKMLYTGCAACHDVTPAGVAAFDAKIAATHANIEAKLEALKNQLIEAGIFNTGTNLANKGTFKANAVYAYINFNMIEEDRSLGIHNPVYTKVLLDNSIAAMTTLGYTGEVK
jgi:hypothetical protein